MRKAIPEIPGRRLSDLSLADQNEVIRTCNRFNNLNARPPLGFTNIEAGAEIFIEPSKRRRGEVGEAGTPSITVLIVKKPALTDTRLRVQAVRYTKPDAAQTDGETDPYAFDGEAFDALPYFGKFARDYEGLEKVAEEELGQPDNRDHFLECKQQGDVWVVERPPRSGGGLRFAYVVAAPGSLGAGTVDVRFQKLADGALVNDGPVTSVLVWPKMTAVDWQQLATPNAIIAVATIDGDDYAMQTLKWTLSPPPNSNNRVNC